MSINKPKYNAKEIIIGGVFGELTVLGEADKWIYPSGDTRRRLLCSCTCGSGPKEYMINAIVGGSTTSCGCVNLARITTKLENNAVHPNQ